jgi:hypothetical protein
VLVELVETEQATVADGWVTVRAGHGHPLAPDLTGAPVERAVTHVGLGLYPALLDRFTEQGTLVRDSTWRGRPVWRVTDRSRRDALVAELTEVLAGDVRPTPRTGALLGLLHALDVAGLILLSHPPARAAAIAAESSPVRAFTGPVADCVRSFADLPGVLLLDDRPTWRLRPSGPPSPSR